ncbi:MAG TPA: response regulator [Edaphobacter sp.]
MSRRQQSEPAAFQRMVVVVDDDPRVRQSLESLLSSAGFDVRVFNSGRQVLESHALAAAGCLITDVRMPGMDGWELFRETADAYTFLPVIFVTAHQDDDAARRSLDGGAFAFLYKPYDGEELLATVDAAFKSKRPDSGNPGLTGL